MIRYTLVIFLTFLIACNSNKDPKCSITSPKNGEAFDCGTIITINIEADDSDGTVTEVRLYIDGVGVTSLSEFPYKYEWNTSDLENGEHIIEATTKDDEGGSSTNEVKIDINGGLLVDIDLNIYNTIKIGSQWWMEENLNTTHYADGTVIPLVESISDWMNLAADDRAYCWYQNDPSYGDTLGALYTWAAAVNGTVGGDDNPSNIQGTCPDGWHLPSDSEWKELEMYVGLSESEVNIFGWRGTNEGGKLKESGIEHWYNPNVGGTNESGFTALGTGFREENGEFNSLINLYSGFWTSTISQDSSIYRMLEFSDSKILRNNLPGDLGFSIRCIED